RHYPAPRTGAVAVVDHVLAAPLSDARHSVHLARARPSLRTQATSSTSVQERGTRIYLAVSMSLRPGAHVSRVDAHVLPVPYARQLALAGQLADVALGDRQDLRGLGAGEQVIITRGRALASVRHHAQAKRAVHGAQ